MPYATSEHLIERFGERMLVDLTDRADEPTGTIDAAVIERALVNTDATIDGYLASKYQMPLAEVPPQIRDLAEMIAIYKLHTFDPPKKIADDHDRAMKTLLDIATGKVRLPIAGVEPPDRTGSGVQTTDRERPFSNENLRGFI